MKKYIFLIVLVLLVLAVMNVAIWQKEHILANGEQVYLELVPVDPRSLMQGDYMQLAYAVNNDSRQETSKNKKEIPGARQMVVAIDDQGIARFVRMEDGSALQANEKRLHFKAGFGRNQSVMPNSFFFQEGHGRYYAQAKYAIFTFAQGSADDYLLTGLADEAQKRIEAKVSLPKVEITK